MKNARKIFSAVVITLLAIVMLFTLAGCGDDYIDYGFVTEPMSVSISFGESFMEAAGVRPHEWIEYLQEQNKEGRASIFAEGDVVVLQVMENDVYEWEVLGINKLDEACQNFAALDESCSIELFENNAIADVSYDEDISRETADEYIAQMRKWCAYLHEYDSYSFNMLEQVNYPDEPPAASEGEYGISFEKVVCRYWTFDDERSIPMIDYVICSDGTVYVERVSDDGIQEAEDFTLTEEQVQTIKDALRCHRVWTVGQIDNDFDYRVGRYIGFFDEEGEYINESECGGYGFASERFNKTAEIIEGIISSEYPQPTQP